MEARGIELSNDVMDYFSRAVSNRFGKIYSDKLSVESNKWIENIVQKVVVNKIQALYLYTTSHDETEIISYIMYKSFANFYKKNMASVENSHKYIDEFLNSFTILNSISLFDRLKDDVFYGSNFNFIYDFGVGEIINQINLSRFLGFVNDIYEKQKNIVIITPFQDRNAFFNIKQSAFSRMYLPFSQNVDDTKSYQLMISTIVDTVEVRLKSIMTYVDIAKMKLKYEKDAERNGEQKDV